MGLQLMTMLAATLAESGLAEYRSLASKKSRKFLCDQRGPRNRESEHRKQ
jgi:hypothetical protein